MIKIFPRPAVWFLIFFAFGIYAGELFACGKAYILAVLLVFPAFYIFLKRKYPFFRKNIFILLFFTAVFGVGYISIQPRVCPNFSNNHIYNFAETGKFLVSGRVAQEPVKTDKRMKFNLQTEKIKLKNGSFIKTKGKIRVTGAGDLPDIRKGDRISFFCKIRKIRSFHNPGGFDYKRFTAFQDVWGSAYTRGKYINIIEKKRDFSAIESFRNKIADIIDKSKNKESAAILKALIIGDKSSVSKEQRDLFNRIGIGHILAVSGLHIGIIAGFVFFVFRFVLARFRFFLWRAWVFKGAAVLSLPLVVLYAIIAGMSPSTQRALIMCCVFLISFIIQKETDIINTLSIAAAVILVMDPASLFSISFQLSFAAVTAIVCGMSFFKKKENRIENSFFLSMKRKIIQFFFVSFFALLGSLPLVMFYFNQVSFAGLLTNFIFVPAIGFIILPLGLFSGFVYPLSTETARFGLFLSADMLDVCLDMIKFFAGFKYICTKTIIPSLFEIAVYYLLFFSGLKAVASFSFPLRKEFGKWAAVCCFGFLIFAADILYWSYQRFWNNDLRVSIIDVGQGISAVLELPRGKVFLIDGGGFYDNSVFDVGAYIVSPFLLRKKIKTVDTIILSHPNSDHFNGLLYIAKNFNVKNFWSNNQPTDTKSYQELMSIIKRKNMNVPLYEKMPKEYCFNNAVIKILYPPEDFLVKSKFERWRDENANSLIVKASIGKKSFLFTGDIVSKSEQEAAASAGSDLRSDVLIVPHHGSSTSSSDLFLKTVSPQIAVVSAGWKNRFNFPHKRVLKRYALRKIKIFRTDINGAVMFSTNGENIRCKTTLP